MRYVRTARVLVMDRPRAADVLGELFEPQIIAMSPQAFTLSGCERVGDKCYAQSWLVRLAEDAWSAVGAQSNSKLPGVASKRHLRDRDNVGTLTLRETGDELP